MYASHVRASPCLCGSTAMLADSTDAPALFQVFLTLRADWLWHSCAGHPVRVCEEGARGTGLLQLGGCLHKVCLP